MSVERITDFIKNCGGMVKSGVFIQKREDIIADQKSWDDEDPCKFDDFSTCPYWITTDDGQDPAGIDNDAELNELMSTITIEIESIDNYQTPDDMTGLFVYFKGASIGDIPPGLSFNQISRRLAVLPDGMCMVVDYQSFL